MRDLTELESMHYTANVLADSISPDNIRLTTLRVTFPRFILAEFNTHRVFSRNAGSSRAISVARRLASVTANPVMPIEWGLEQKGMSASVELDVDAQIAAADVWCAASLSACAAASQLAELGVHKQVVNRLLEPFSWVTVVVSSTLWENFFALRCHAAAQPEMQVLAAKMRTAIEDSVPVQRAYCEYHLPSILDSERTGGMSMEDLLLTAAGRLARVSYEVADNTARISEDQTLAKRLMASGHWSPFEHLACAVPDTRHQEQPSSDCRNYVHGWAQYRAQVD